MKTTNNTILITGSSAGIGFEMAKALSAQGNHVIITGRDAGRLNKAGAQLKNVTVIPVDVSREEGMDHLVTRVKAEFPQLNMLINNAGKAQAYNLAEESANAYAIAKDEMQLNYFAVIRLTEKLLPLLKLQPESAIVNVSSTVAFVPAVAIATYSASKAALHAYTQALRQLLCETSSVKVFEVMPPLVNTELSKDIGGEHGIHPSVVAEDLVKALAADHYEIHVGQTANLYQLFLASPAEAFKQLNGLGKPVKS